MQSTLRRRLVVDEGERQEPTQGGFTLVEVAMVAGILAFAFLAFVGGLGSNFKTVDRARETTRAARFLEQTMASVDATAYDDLLALDGSVVLDDPIASRAVHQVALTVAQSGPNLIRVRAILSVRRTGRVVTTLMTLRTRL